MNSPPIIVCADLEIVRIVHAHADRLQRSTISGESYGDIAEQLFPTDERKHVQPGAIVWDVRSSSDLSRAVKRCHDLVKLLQDLLFDAPVPRPVLLLIEAHQSDARWLQHHPAFQSVIGQSIGGRLTVLHPVDDGSWETDIGASLAAIYSAPGATALPD